MNTPKFSIVMIAKNEAKTLPKCIESLKDFISRKGEIILCDTGSTDGTAGLARSLGCTVTEVGSKFITIIDEETATNINKKFIVDGEEEILQAGNSLFDFAAARNYATSLAKNDMVCTLDADEAYSVFDIDKLNSLIDEGYQQFEYQFVYAHNSYGKPTIQFVQSKFFDRRVVSWSGIVHEVLGGNAKIKLLGQDIILLEHWQQQQGDHRGNYLVGLALDCYQNPDKDRQSHYFARELMWKGRPKSALKEFKRHVAMNRWVAECSQSMIFMGDIFGRLNQLSEQIEWYSKAFHHDPNRREALIKLAYFYKFNNKPLAIIAYAKAALEIPWTDYYANDRAMYEHIPHELLYWAYGWVGNIPEAQKHILKALSYCPSHPDYARDTKYYFGYPDNGIEGWMTFEELSWLNKMAKNHLSIAELGSWKGRSTHALATACKGTITAIDTWLGSSDVKDLTNRMAKQEDVFETFKKNTKQFNNIVTNRNKGNDAAKNYSDKSFDVVFIDAGHTYEEVKEDINTWLPKAKMILCGHDYLSGTWMEVIKAVDEKFGKPDGLAYSIWYKYLVPKVSFIIPTLGRPEGLKRCLDSINNLNYPKELIEVIVLDGEGTVPQKVAKGLWQAKNEYIVFASNDIEFTPDSLYNALQIDKGLVAFNTGIVGPDEGNICEHFIIKKDLIKRLGGEIFDTDFNHVGCDNLLWAKAKKLGENGRSENAIVYHYHFSKGQPFDDVYEKGWKHVKKDRELLAKKLQPTIKDFKGMIERSENFSFIKQGDGEIFCMRGDAGGNCDGHPYSKELGEALKDAYTFLNKLPNSYITKWDEEELESPVVSKGNVGGDTFLHNDVSQDKFDFFKTLKFSKRKKIFIGPSRLKGVISFLNIDEYIEIPIINSFTFDFNTIPEDNAIYLFSAGMPSKVWITKLLKMNQNITCIDIGSGLDPLFHRITRTRQLDGTFLNDYYKELLNETKITVVLCIKNREKLRTKKCIDSLLNQSTSCKIIVVDYGSNDKSWYPEIFKNVELIEVTSDTEPFNKSRALNIGIKKVDTMFTISSDIDIVFDHNFIEEALKALMSNNKAIVLCRKIDLSESGLPENLHELNASGSCIGINTQWFKKVRGYDEYYIKWGKEDNDLTDRAVQDNYEIIWIENKTNIYHQFHEWKKDENRISWTRNNEYYNIPNKSIIRNPEEWGMLNPYKFLQGAKCELGYMIPKTIFTIWLSDNPILPSVVKLCIESQKIKSYEHKLVTLDNCYRNKYIQEAIDAKQWGKASDYLRCWYLIQEGGIYLDADVYVLLGKNFDHLLNNNVFASKEENGFINTAVMGAKKGSQLLIDHLIEVENKFTGNDGKFFESSLELITPRLYEAQIKGLANILLPEIFYPYNHQKNTINIKDDTITLHFFMKSWVS